MKTDVYVRGYTLLVGHTREEKEEAGKKPVNNPKTIIYAATDVPNHSTQQKLCKATSS